MPKETIETEADEKEVQEVRCNLTGVPIPSVPNWYASVRVKFVSDHARLKSGALLRAPEVVEPEVEDPLAEATEISLEDVEEDLVVEDEIDLDIGGEEEVADIDEE